MTEIAKWIKGLRDHLKLNQDEFGDLFGATQGTVSRWERTQKPKGDMQDLLEAKAMESGYPTFRKPLFDPRVTELAGWLTELSPQEQTEVLNNWRNDVERAKARRWRGKTNEK